MRASAQSAPPASRSGAGPGALPELVVKAGARAVQSFLAGDGPHYAASISFRVLFSLFPLTIVLAAVFGIAIRVTGLQTDVVDAIVRNVPLTGDGREDLRTLLDGATGSSSTIGLVALVGLLWAASGMMAAIRGALNAVWDVDDDRPFLQGKALDLLLVLGAALLVAASLVLSVGGRLASRYADEALADAGLGAGVTSVLGGIVVPLLLSFATVLFLYRVVPATARPLGELLPGVAFVAAVFVLLQSLFALYLEHFANYNAVYGSLGAVIAFLFFVYVASLVFLLGAHLSAAIPEVKEELRRPSRDGGTPLRKRLLGALAGLVRRG